MELFYVVQYLNAFVHETQMTKVVDLYFITWV